MRKRKVIMFYVLRHGGYNDETRNIYLVIFANDDNPRRFKHSGRDLAG